MSNSIVLGHDASYLPFISKGEFEDLEDYLYLIFYDEDPATTYDIMVENEVDYLILTEEMTEYGIYVHDYQHDPISNVFIENLEESIYFSKVFSNSGLIVFKVN